MINTRYKTTACKYWEQDKTCPLGAKCHFAHGKDDLRKLNDPLPQNAPMMPNSKVQQQMPGMVNPMMMQNVNNFKTVICKYWEQGKCKYQHNCSFAHGNTDVRNGNQAALNMNGYDPLKDPNIEYMMKLQQLNMIGSALEELYPNDQMIVNYVKNAMQMLATNNINGGAETLQKILYNSNASEEMKKKHEEIVQNAKKFAESSYDMLRVGQIPDFMLQMQQQSLQTQMAMQSQVGMQAPRN